MLPVDIRAGGYSRRRTNSNPFRYAVDRPGSLFNCVAADPRCCRRLSVFSVLRDCRLEFHQGLPRRWRETTGARERLSHALRDADFPGSRTGQPSVPSASRALRRLEHFVAPAAKHPAKTAGPGSPDGQDHTKRNPPPRDSGSTHLVCPSLSQNSSPSRESCATTTCARILQPIHFLAPKEAS